MIFMKVSRKKLDSFFIVICCFFCSPHFVYAQDSALTNLVRISPERRADRLCYVATYYGDMSHHFDQMMHQFNFRQPYIDDFVFREGVAEWLFIDRNSLRSAFTDLSFSGGGGRENFFSNTAHVNNLINSRGFEDAIRRCAEKKGLVFEDLLENMRSTILRIDNRANWFGRAVQNLPLEIAGGLVFHKVIGGVSTVNSWIFTPQVRSWLSQTGLVKVLRNRIAFFREHKAAALGVVGVPVISATTIGDTLTYRQIYQENQVSIENAPAHVIEEGVEEWKDKVSPIGVLWDDRWINTKEINIGEINIEEKQGQYRNMIRMFAETGLDHLDNEISLPRDIAIRIDLYFVDYWFVSRILDSLRATKGEYHPDTLELNIIKELFDFRRRQLESQTTQDSPERAVALELLNLSRDYEFLCDFNELSEDTRPDLLCKIHSFYTVRSRNGGLSPGSAAQLQQMEAKLESL